MHKTEAVEIVTLESLEADFRWMVGKCVAREQIQGQSKCGVDRTRSASIVSGCGQVK